MTELVVSAATGALKPLLEKLAAALGEEYKRFKGVRGEIRSLAEELNAMHVFLLKMSDEENPNVQDKAWMKEVRELSYDMEDCIDEFMLCVDDKSNPDGFIAKIKKSVDKMKTRRQIAKAIEDLKIQVKEVGDRNVRYMTRETISKTSNADVDRRALVIFENASKLVGLDRPKKELIELLTDESGLASLQPPEVTSRVGSGGSGKTTRPKVISIVGCGGSGKTTLAYQVYRELQGDFQSHAFMSVSRNPDSMKVLRNILHQVSDGPHHNIEDWNLQVLISKISDFLKDKRYLIVIDDIWTKEAWEKINFALCNNDKNSKIITTTRIYDVAKGCCSLDGDFVYQMKPIGPADSRKLFLERLFGSEYKCPAHLRRISDKILEKCDGLPLAIISISGLLASKAPTEDEWDQVQNSIGRGLAKNGDAESMMQILSLSYFDLPHYLKTCVLYLSVFPEDFTIDKKRLVKRWIAEGFIQKEQGQTLYELGERCFNELINRSLIQARDINKYGEVRACQVHDTILDFIISKSEDENFVTVFGDGYQIMHGPHSKVRRLSAHVNSKEKASTLSQLNLSHVRTVTMFGYFVELPFWPKLSFLRVLDLQGCWGVQGHHLTDIGSLFQLKYLGLGRTGVRELPGQIWKLKCLETLDLKKSKVKKLPADIAQLQRLVYLAVDKGVKLPDGIARMAELADLDCVDIFQQSIYFPRELGELKNLTNVCLFIRSDNSSVAAEGTNYKEYLSSIASSLCKLGHLQSLSIEFDPSIEEDSSLDSGDDAPAELRKFEMTGHFISKVPNWMRPLKNLRWLTLYVNEFEVEDIMALGRLPVLLFLRLVAHQSFQGRWVTITGTDGFRSLRHFDYGCAIPVTFKAGAMPEVKKFTLLFSFFKTRWTLRNVDFISRVGIQHLTSLDSVDCLLYYDDKEMCDWVDEKKTQMVSMSCEQAKATICEMDGTVKHFFEIETAARNLIKSPGLAITTTTQWGVNKENFVTRHFPSSFKGIKARRKLRNINVQIDEWIRNCPLRGEGNCQCQDIRS